MKFSMNGFRRELSGEISDLRDMVRDVIKGEWYDKQDLADQLNKVITLSNVVNCVYNAEDPDFTDMNHLEIEHLEIEEGAQP